MLEIDNNERVLELRSQDTAQVLENLKRQQSTCDRTCVVWYDADRAHGGRSERDTRPKVRRACDRVVLHSEPDTSPARWVVAGRPGLAPIRCEGAENKLGTKAPCSQVGDVRSLAVLCQPDRDLRIGGQTGETDKVRLLKVESYGARARRYIEIYRPHQTYAAASVALETLDDRTCQRLIPNHQDGCLAESIEAAAAPVAEVFEKRDLAGEGLQGLNIDALRW